MAFSSTEQRDAQGRFTDGGTVGEHVDAHPKGAKHALRELAMAHKRGEIAFEEPQAGHGARVTAWVKSARIQERIGGFAKTVVESAKDPETVKSVLGVAVNGAIGHYVYTHDTIDSEIVAHAIQHVQIGLAVSVDQAKGILTRLVEHLRGALAGAAAGVGKSIEALHRALSVVHRG